MPLRPRNGVPPCQLKAEMARKCHFIAEMVSPLLPFRGRNLAICPQIRKRCDLLLLLGRAVKRCQVSMFFKASSKLECEAEASQGILLVAGKLLEDVFRMHGIMFAGKLGIGKQAHRQPGASVLRSLASVVRRQPCLHIHGIAVYSEPSAHSNTYM